MADFPNEGSFWNILNAGTMASESTSNSQFPGFSSQALMTPEQQAFLQFQQQTFLAFQQTFQNIQQNPPQQQSQSSNSIPQQTDSQPKRTRVKHAAKRSKGKEAEPTGDVTTLRWSSDEEALLAECFVAVSEDRNVGRSQAKDTFWIRVMHEFNRKIFQKRTKDMLTSKWTTLNHHCQKFNAIYKRCHRLKKSGESEVDLMGRARGMYQDENKNSPFNHDKAWAILRQHAKWDAPEVANQKEQRGDVKISKCMLANFHDMIEESVEVFMDDFSVFGNSFDKCLNNLDKMLQLCKDARLVLNWEKCHFMVKEGIMLGHKVSSAGLEVDKAKIDVI
ncbi:hypothetical protein Tco_0492405 [Tanacetum coccineum]